MNIIDHLTELRMRIVRSMLAIAVGATVILVFMISFYVFSLSLIAIFAWLVQTLTAMVLCTRSDQLRVSRPG